MKILYVATEVPYPPNSGVKIPLYHAMRLMEKAGHEIALAVLTEDVANSESDLKGLRTVVRISDDLVVQLPKRKRWEVMLKSVVSQRMYFLERYNSTEFRNKLAQLIELFEPDAIHFDLITMSGYLDCKNQKSKAIASINDSYSLFIENNIKYGLLGWKEKFFRRLQLMQARNYEARVYPRFDCVHTMTEFDAAYLRRLNGSVKTVAISNGVEDSILENGCSSSDRKDVIYVGSLRGKYMRLLISFIQNCWPVILDGNPLLRLRLVGKVTADSKELVDVVDSVKGVVFEGFVPDLNAVYHECGIAFVPIKQSCGLINKLVEAMGAGLAVVAPALSYTGVPKAEHYKNAIMCDSEQEITEAVCELLRNDELRTDIQKSARALVASEYRWSDRSDLYEKMYYSILNE